MIDDVVAAVEDQVGEPIVPNILPDVLLAVQLRTFSRQWDDGDVGRDVEASRKVPSRLVRQHGRMPAGRDFGGDGCEMQIHGVGVAPGEDEAGGPSGSGADGAEDVGGAGALIAWRRGPAAAPGPAAGDLVLLADTCLIGEPDFDIVFADFLLACDRIQCLWEVFLNCSMAPAACA
jgi:hypothetical protein